MVFNISIASTDAPARQGSTMETKMTNPPATPATKTLLQQLLDSQALYAAELARYEELTDDELSRVLDTASGCLNALVPVVADLDAKVADSVSACGLDMSAWHCGTTHCRGGWAITHAGEAGAALEKAVGEEVAARLIYEASTGRVAPNFWARNDDALADIKRCAEVSA